MTIYPDEQKTTARRTALIERMLPPQNEDVPRLSHETGIPKDTLYGWRRRARRARGLVPPSRVGGGERWGAEEKFAMAVETAALSEAKRWDGPPASKLLERMSQLQQETHTLQRERRQLHDRLDLVHRREQALLQRLSLKRTCKRRKQLFSDLIRIIAIIVSIGYLANKISEMGFSIFGLKDRERSRRHDPGTRPAQNRGFDQFSPRSRRGIVAVHARIRTVVEQTGLR